MRLPELTARPARAERPSLAAVRPTDLGLGAVAQEVGAWSQEVERTKAIEEELVQVDAEEKVRPILERVQSEFESEFNVNGANWDASEPGFARSITGKLNERLTGLGDDLPLTPSERAALQRGAAQYRVGVGQRAVAYEGQRRGAVAAEAVQARETVETGGMMGRYMASMADGRSAIDNAYDGSQADYAGQVLALHDQTAAAVLEETPDNLKPRVIQRLAETRLQLQGQAIDVEQRGEQAYVVGQARSAGDQLINAVLTSPSMAETAAPMIEEIVSALPAGARAGERSRLFDAVGEARVSGMIRDGQEDQALELLNSGTLDTQLRPETKARLLSEGMRKRDELTADDFIGQLRTEQLMQDNLASIAATGVEIEGADPGSLNLEPADLARYTLNIERARAARAATPDMARMTPGQINAHVESLKPVEGSPGFAEAQAAYELASGAARREIEAREADPAAWAVNASPALKSMLQGMGSANPDTARRSAGAYAVGVLQLQEQAGIPAANRRIFSKGAAEAIVQAAETNADPVEGLRGLANVVNAFRPPAGSDDATRNSASSRRYLAIRDLIAGGAEPADVAAAVSLGGRGAAMGAYTAADRAGTLTSMEAADRERLTGAVNARLSPYFASLQGQPNNDGLNDARRTMAVKLAAGRMVTRPGVSADDAARWAADQIAAPYTFIGPSSLRVPDAVANRTTQGVVASGQPGYMGGQTSRPVPAVTEGMARLMRMITDRDGAGWWDPQNNPSMDPAQRRRLYGDQVRQTGRWVARGDDSGAAFVYRNNEGQWVTARNAQGRPISASWDALAAARLDPEASQAAPARPRQAAQAAAATPAWSAAIRAIETGDNPARVSRDPDGAGPARGGAVGAMQLLPETAQRMARRLGIPYDQRRLLNDVAYNTRLGNEYLSFLSQRYGGSMLLATTAYFAGEGSVDGWLRRHGDPRTGSVSASAWLSRVGRLNPRSARYPRAVFARMGISIDGGR